MKAEFKTPEETLDFRPKSSLPHHLFLFQSEEFEIEDLERRSFFVIQDFLYWCINGLPEYRPDRT